MSALLSGSDLKYRHELKYPVNSAQIEIIRSRISEILQPDPNLPPENDGSYQVRSVYFDDYRNSCFYENEDGVDPRQKFRIRIYNHSDAVINLELKRKQSGKTLKQSCRLNRETAENLLEGTLAWSEDLPPLLKQFYLLQETRLLLPKMIVVYDRIPYIYTDGNVRITFDTNIRASADIASFFDEDIHGRLVMPLNQHLLEVKFDEFLPDFIYRSVQSEHLQQTTFSKYYICRKFGGIR